MVSVIVLGLLVIFAAVKMHHAFNVRPRPRVIDGIMDTDHKYEFVVALYGSHSEVVLINAIEFVCSGSLISEHWVLTASHCLGGISVIRYGDFTVPSNSSTAQYSSVIEEIRHPNFHLREGVFGRYFLEDAFNDIALIHVHKVSIAAYGRLSAVDYRTLAGLPTQYVGFGLTYSSDMNKADIVRLMKEDSDNPRRRYGDAVVVKCNKEKDKRHLRMYLDIGPAVCLAPKCNRKKQSIHHGDSGGPAIIGGKIVGVLTDGFPVIKYGISNYLGPPDHPHVVPVMVYTAISPFMDWINRIVGKKTK